MSLPVFLRPEASRDAQDSRDYLEGQREGLGKAFMERLNESLSRIGASPESYGIIWRHVRAARLRRFTYVVYYRVHNDRVEVLGVIHGGRDASAWHARA